KARLLPGLLLLLSCGPVAAEPAQMLPFPAVETREAREAARRAAEEALVEELVLHRCLPDREWCAELVRDGESWRLELVGRAGERRVRFEPPDREVGDPIFALWPQLVREADGAVMVGLLASRRTGYSGGGALATRLILVRLEPGAAQAAAVLAVPVEGSSMVRACFSEDDMRLRREACHDDYQFSGTLTLAPDGTGGYPQLLLATRARTYPGDVTRWEDSAERPPLRRGDLVWAEHPGCSYRRTFVFDSAAGRYVADVPLPDCGQFLVGEVALTEQENPAPPD
ncbi:MAG TPA: hypothetical protein VJS15_04990, partial [Allosphingosinicella sp.]|nr:hypothetical protein [Allosphingosinicella sp.]